MKETLFIRPAPSGNTASWCLHVQQSGFAAVLQGTLEEALGHCAGRRVVILVPAADVMLMAADMPARLAAGQGAKVQRAVPFILEERLAEDVETLHFAIGGRLPNGQIPVAIVSREKMEAWMAPLRARGITPALMVTDTQCLPLTRDSKSTWSVLLEGKRATVRTGAYSGFACEAEMLGDYLSLAEAPADLRLRVYPAGEIVAGGASNALPGLSIPVDFAQPVADGLEYLLRGFDESTFINLLQGEYASQLDYQRWLRPWRAALAMLGIWLILGLLMQGLEHYRLKHELSRLDQSAEAAFRATFPQITHIVDIRAQAQQQLAVLHKSGGSVGFLKLLQGTSNVLAANPGLKLQEIQFREGALSLGLEAGDIQALDALQQSFATQPGLVLEVQSANAGSQGVQIRARVKARS